MTTHPARKPGKDEDAFPTRQLTILAICRFSEPIAFTSILAYTYVMVKELQNGDDTNASFYAGLLVSAFAVAEALTAMIWGAISDRYGRKPIVLIGLGGVALSSLIFGLAKKYWVALLARFIGGALNGNVAVMQTMVAEMVKKPEHEPRAYAVQPFVWALGSIIGSAMGGFLAQPARFYPGTFSEDGIFGQYPYLLPNLVAVVVIVIAIIQGILFLDETNPRFKQTDEQADHADHAIDDDSVMDETASLLRGSNRRSIVGRRSIVEGLRDEARRRTSFLEESLPSALDQSFDIRRSSFATIYSIQKVPGVNQSHLRHVAHADDPPEKTFNFSVLMLTLVCVLISYHQMAFYTILPVYLLDTPISSSKPDLIGGLGYTVHDVGIFMAVNGVIALIIQGAIFPVFVEKVGVWRSFFSLIILYPICYVIIPFLSVLPRVGIPAGLYVALSLQNFFGIIIFPCALILLKNATPSPLVLGKVNGLAMSACCIARTLSPPLVGIIYSAGGSAAAFWSTAGFAVIGVIQVFFVPRERMGKVAVQNPLAGKSAPQNNAEESNAVAEE